MDALKMPSWLPWALLVAVTAAAPPAPPTAEAAPKRWNDDQLVASCRDLDAAGGLEAAVRSPTLPKDPPQPGFLDALAWYAAGSPDRDGQLTLKKLDEVLASNVDAYIGLLKAKVERAQSNDFARTRTWKVVQKLTLLRGETMQPQRKGRYPYTANRKASGDPSADAWDKEHTLQSSQEFAEKVCRGSATRPVLVKFGNTNCTQCMLFEMIGSVKAFAENPAHKAKVDVYKAWWGFRPDEGFAGRIKDPQLLTDLAKAEGVSSSPYFIVYRNGRRYPCGDSFPDDQGRDDRLDACLGQQFGEATESPTCAALEAPKEVRKDQ